MEIRLYFPGNKLFAIGGYDSTGHVTDAVSVYDIEGDTWENSVPLNHPRAYASSCKPLVNPGLPYPMPYVFGGVNDDGALVSVEQIPINPEESVSDIQMPEKRYWHATEYQFWYQVILYGGFNEINEPSTDVFIYEYHYADLNEGSWTKLDTKLPEITSPFASASHYHSIDDDKECIYAIGGATPDFWTDGDGPRVTGVNLKYCMPGVSTKTDETAQSRIHMHGNYPNPATEQTVISFELPGTSEVTIEITNLSGQFLGEILNGRFEAGKHEITCDLSQLPAGIYFYQMKTEYGMASRKMIVQ
jgi:hypothetical protein